MLAAYSAARNGHQVTLLEKNEKLGKKLFITGKGRCNVTNACEVEDLFKNVISNSKFLYSSFYTFDNQAIVDLLAEYGCTTKVERGDRVFPVSDRSSDVIGALTRALKAAGVEIRLYTEVSEICMEQIIPIDAVQDCAACDKEAVYVTECDKKAVCNMGSDNKAGCGSKKAVAKHTSRIVGIKTVKGEFIKAEAVIVCTGGVSYPITGSDGDGYLFAEKAGMEVVEAKPALVPLECRESWCGELMGLSLRNVQVTLLDGKKKIFQDFGEMLFTHFGVSGPLILSASSHYVKKYYSKEVSLFIDLKPALSEEQLDKRVLRDFEENINKQFKNAVGGLFPSKLVPVMIALSGIDPEKKVHEISKEERQHFVHLIKQLPLTVTGTRSFAEAIITQGGVVTKDVNPSTMESKTVRGLYFAGEVLDLDAVTGGFNLQIAWSTGYLAGSSIS